MSARRIQKEEGRKIDFNKKPGTPIVGNQYALVRGSAENRKNRIVTYKYPIIVQCPSYMNRDYFTVFTDTDNKGTAASACVNTIKINRTRPFSVVGRYLLRTPKRFRSAKRITIIISR